MSLPENVEPEILPAADCHSMADIRQAIDAIDRSLVKLMAQRQTYVERAAVVKPARSAVHDAARIEDVVRKVLAAANAENLSPCIAEPVWRLLIERSIAHEFAAFDAR